MDSSKKKCSSKKHLEIEAINYCYECKLYLCNKCQNLHSELLDSHHLYDVNKNINDIFTGYCKEKKHNIELEYFCKTHNQLCCAACIAKIKGEGNGQHTDCDISLIKDIKNDKKNKLKDNIKSLEDLSNKLEQSINELKSLFKTINESKEELKLKIQKIFTNIRNTLNEREDYLLLEVENQYNNLFFSEDIIKESERLPNKIKISLEAGKKLDNEWMNDDKLNSYINDCVNIENNIKNINIINEKIEKCKLNKNTKIIFSPEKDDEINKFLETFKSFGNIYKENMFKNKIQSKIVSSNDLLKIEKWLTDSIGNVNNYELIYRATEHGDSNSISFSKCKNIPNLIWIMKDKNNNIFGCFNSISIGTSGSYSKDSKCFLYSLNKNKKYLPNLSIINNIYHCSSHIIEFGCNSKYEFNIGDKFLTSDATTITNGTIFNHNQELFNNSSTVLTELEVFKVIQ